MTEIMLKSLNPSTHKIKLNLAHSDIHIPTSGTNSDLVGAYVTIDGASVVDHSLARATSAHCSDDVNPSAYPVGPPQMSETSLPSPIESVKVPPVYSDIRLQVHIQQTPNHSDIDPSPLLLYMEYPRLAI